MNFFQSQDAARKNTKLLVFLFVMAVLILIAMTNLLLIGVLTFARSPVITMTELKDQFSWDIFILVGMAVITLVGIASLYKIIQLSGGGERVAEMMDGELIIDSNGDIHKQRVLNIVEEMAIASGTPVPPVYLINDDAINAFAAGTTTGNAVIGVTSGTIKKLNRAQLQGVIAHEFSHIRNGDMRLNIRLIGLLNGILIIGTIGYFLLRSSSRGVRSRNSKNGGAGAIIIIGLGLMIIGYSGTFFGNIIKAAVSRQREYLADASAVQFTRDKDGIAGALKRIGGNVHGSIMRSPSTAEISHTLFSQGISTMFDSLFATHPPLEKRIRAIQPNWDGEFEIPPEIETSADNNTEPVPDKDNKIKQAVISGTTVIAAHAAIEEIIQAAGQPSADHLSYAQKLIATLPDDLRQAAHNPYTARAVIYYLLLDTDPAVGAQQLSHLKEKGDVGIYDETLKLSERHADLDSAYRLPLVEIALGSLRQLSMHQYLMFKDNIDALVKMDNKINLFEWSLQKIVFHHLKSVYERIGNQSQTRTLSTLKNECAMMLSFLIHAGKQDGISADNVFQSAIEILDFTDLKLIDIETINLIQLNTSLDKLQNIRPLSKPRLLKACATCITADKQITSTEAELFRAFAAILDCPMPPLQV